MSTSNKQFQLRTVSFQIEKKPILQDVSLTLEGQKIYALIGTSGAGKTTLLQLLAGLKQPTNGTLQFGNQTPKEIVISLVPQEYGLLPWQTARQAVLAGRKISRQQGITPTDQAFVSQLFEKMQLTAVADKYPNQLSGGQKQRVAITRGLASQSELLLMDEPFSALDAFTRETAQQLFLDSWHEAPRLTVFVTHDIEEALLLAHEVIVLESNPGRVKQIITSPFQEKQQLADERQSELLFQTTRLLRKEIEG